MTENDENQTSARSVTGMVRAAPGLVRIAASAAWHTTGWTVGVSMRAGSRAVRAAVSGQSPRDLFDAAGRDLREYLRYLLGIVDLEERFMPADEEPLAAAGNGGPPEASTDDLLRRQGAELLRRSADVDFTEDAHPAYERMLAELAPDEGRILRMLAVDGPQPSVDVRSGFIGPTSELVALGQSMIGAEAGCRYPDRVHSYLNNLHRLGLVWFSREQVTDRLRYQVLEAQPEVLDAIKRAGRSARTVRRSIHLTPFGHDFCEQCLPLGDGAQAPANGAGPAEQAEDLERLEGAEGNRPL